MTGTERKVFQKYYPPDFDPSKIPRGGGKRSRVFVQRVMTPFNMQCDTCHEYIYKGKKFNMKRETVDGETYLGLRIFRFYFKCPNCLAEITFKTDLENCDYTAESGATRLFEAFKLYKEAEAEKERVEAEEAKDPMKMLEKRTKASRAEMEAMGKVEELLEMNRRHEGIGINQALGEDTKLLTLAEQLARQEEEDEELVRQMFGRQADGRIERRIKEEDEEAVDQKPPPLPAEVKIEEEDDIKPSTSAAAFKAPPAPAPKRPSTQQTLLSGLLIRKKPKADVPSTSAPTAQATGALGKLTGLGAYGSDSDSSDG